MELALCDCGSWLSGLCKAVSPHMMLGFQVHREGSEEGTITSRLEPTSLSWSPMRKNWNSCKLKKKMASASLPASKSPKNLP